MMSSLRTRLSHIRVIFDCAYERSWDYRGAVSRLQVGVSKWFSCSIQPSVDYHDIQVDEPRYQLIRFYIINPELHVSG